MNKEWERDHNRDHGRYDSEIESLKIIVNEIRDDVKSLLQFKAGWLAVSGAVSAIIAGVVSFIAGLMNAN